MLFQASPEWWPLGKMANYWDLHICTSECLSLCLSTCISQEPYVRIIMKFSDILPAVVAQSSSRNSVINCVNCACPVLCMISCCHLMEQMGQNQRRCIYFLDCRLVVGIIIRSTPPSRPNKVGLKCPSVRPSIHKKFLLFQWNLVCV